MVNWDNIINLITYDKNSPLLFTSGRFLFIFLAFYILFLILKRKRYIRIVYLTIFSLYFYFQTSGYYLLILILMSIFDYIIANCIYYEFNWKRRTALFITSIVIDLGVLCYFKYTNFLVEIFSDITDKHFEFRNIFLPAGISFFVFQSISYVADIFNGDNVRAKKYIDYLFFLSFFPHILAGPIVRAKKFLPQIYEDNDKLSREAYNTAFLLIIVGLVKKVIISDYISLNLIDRIMDDPIMFTGFENLIGVYGYTLQIYLDFSGYSDLAIGLALLVGYQLPLNFNRPYLSATPTEFWRRWHITLSFWLRDYLYIPLGGNRHGKFRHHINLIITMLIGGLWHGAALRFIFWGFWHGLGLCIHKIMVQLNPSIKTFSKDMNMGWRIIATFLTFHFVCIGWIFFRVDSFEKAINVIEIIFDSFKIELIPQILFNYYIQISLIVFGYIMVFLPNNIHDWIFRMIRESSLPLKAIMLVIVFWIIIQVKSSDIQSFIYFQF